MYGAGDHLETLRRCRSRARCSRARLNGGARPGVADADVFGLVLVTLDVRHDPEGDARAIGPAQGRAVEDGGVGDEVRVHSGVSGGALAEFSPGGVGWDR